MRKLICLMSLVGLISVAFAQKPQEKSPWQSMVDTERAFAAMSEEQGTRPAFMAFIADDGILFRPVAVKGKQWMTEHPVPASDKRPVLSWQPTFADIARAGDMGYTTGPWEYRSDAHDAKASAFGNFLTVWKKQPDGSWKFAIDLGISNPQPNGLLIRSADGTVAEAAILWTPPYRRAMVGRRIDVKSETTALLARDREFSSTSVTWSPAEAFPVFAADGVRVFTEGNAPIVGKDAAVTSMPKRPYWRWVPAFADVSSSGDLGYTYGTYWKQLSPTGEETGNYFRIWKRTGGGKWLVVADLTNPVPEKKN